MKDSVPGLQKVIALHMLGFQVRKFLKNSNVRHTPRVKSWGLGSRLWGSARRV